jgi:hypothetical protein
MPTSLRRNEAILQSCPLLTFLFMIQLAVNHVPKLLLTLKWSRWLTRRALGCRQSAEIRIKLKILDYYSRSKPKIASTHLSMPFSVSCYLLTPDLSSYRSCCSQGLRDASSWSSSSTFAPAHSLLCPCSESPWPGRFFLPYCSSHLRFLPWLPPLSFVPILFLCPFSVIPLCS